jgi:cell wall-associated NlpC family hydrolase
MSLATLRARLGVTAASLVIVGLGLIAAPSLASAGTIDPASSAGTIGPANSPKTDFGAVSTGRQTTRAHRLHAEIVKRHNIEVRKVLKEASRQRGKPYIYGDDGPHGFDCSGLVRFVFLHAVHRSLPHNAAAQYHSLRHIRRHHLKLGDLVFVDNGGYISHVGIYDGHDHWWVAPHSGTRVQRQRIYHAHLLYARVLVYNKHPHHKKK